ncbi:hypothetical protein AAFF_G00303190 [Aldrovandia affinis]|uniref:GDNF/GAS1 domain-containing protein n=1 Tax=Aldrovandia affinis TaxID=143900 RepID=A0AAD7R827_9TELE|nr:hypothetical protein AAFF_G00303190 [Aldrovandia affinis]
MMCYGSHRSRWAQFQYDCQPAEQSSSGCMQENYRACLLAYTGMIGSTITPNYVDNSTSSVSPSCSCSASGNQRGQCVEFLSRFTDNMCLRNAIAAFGNGTDINSTPNQSMQPSQATDREDPTTAPPIATETERNNLNPLMPTQVTERDRLWEGSTLPSSGLSSSAPIWPRGPASCLHQRSASTSRGRPQPLWLFL